MKKQKVGLVLFWIGVIWGFFWGILASIHQAELYLGVLTFEQLAETIWAVDGPIMAIWGLAPPLAAIIAGVGVLIYSGVKRLFVWFFAIGIFLAIILGMIIRSLGHFPPLYAIGGTLILLFFFWILLLWAKERKDLEGQVGLAADYKLVGYVFLLNAAWFTCGIAGPAWHKALVDMPLLDPIFVMILHVLGWFFLFLSHYKSRQQLGSDEL